VDLAANQRQADVGAVMIVFAPIPHADYDRPTYPWAVGKFPPPSTVVPGSLRKTYAAAEALADKLNQQERRKQ
jgi:hypothetical protein